MAKLPSRTAIQEVVVDDKTYEVVISTRKQDALNAHESCMLRIYPGFDACFFMVELSSYLRNATAEQLDELLGLTVELDPGETD